MRRSTCQALRKLLIQGFDQPVEGRLRTARVDHAKVTLGNVSRTSHTALGGLLFSS